MHDLSYIPSLFGMLECWMFTVAVDKVDSATSKDSSVLICSGESFPGIMR